VIAVRVAAYYAPEEDDPLWAAGNAWLGRDPETGATLSQPPVPGIADAGIADLGMTEITAEPRRYGFHATLKPPMNVATSWAAVVADAERLADRIAPFDLPPLAVANLSGFLALRETRHAPPLHAFADSCIEALDRHRAPPSPEELAQRRAGEPLSAEQERMLARWGYPAAFATWRFHMTLSRRLDDAGRARIGAAAEAWFRDALAVPRRVASLCLFTQREPGAPFMLARRLPLRG
jgi:putative phosphonate metabolism protein